MEFYVWAPRLIIEGETTSMTPMGRSMRSRYAALGTLALDNQSMVTPVVVPVK